MKNSPLVSCVCVTKRTLEEIQISIECFLSQSYKNRELIVLHDGGDFEIEEYISEMNNVNTDCNLFYHQYESNHGTSLGELRNISIGLSSGEFVCQWDDDDWMHKDRISRQFHAMRTNFQTSCVLTNLLIYDRERREGYLSEFRLWEGSILFDRKIISNTLKYPEINRGEDSVFFNGVVDSGCYPLIASNLYIYIIHGSNTWPRQHFEGIKSRSRRLPVRSLSIIDGIVSGQLSVLDGSEILDSAEFLSSMRYSIPTNLAGRKLSDYVDGMDF